MNRDKRYSIAALPGDGIGAEIMQSAEQVLDAVASRISVGSDLNYQKAGTQHYLDTGVTLTDSVLNVCNDADAILFGAMITEQAVEQVFAQGLVRPMEFGGPNGSADVTKAVLTQINAA